MWKWYQKKRIVWKNKSTKPCTYNKIFPFTMKFSRATNAKALLATNNPAKQICSALQGFACDNIVFQKIACTQGVFLL
jgi:hypothetical protein